MLKNVGSNWLVTVVTVLAVYLLTPYTIHKLGDDGYHDAGEGPDDHDDQVVHWPRP